MLVLISEMVLKPCAVLQENKKNEAPRGKYKTL